MIKIVIVDDEKMIREGLVSTMPWKKMGIKVIGAAGDGKKALEISRRQKPHIILTDVRMPIMNGLELLKIIKDEMPWVKVVILSGHDEFAYVQQAIKYGAIDYLMKPVVAEELEDVIIKVKKSLNKEINKDIQRLKIQKKIESELDQFFNAVKFASKENAFSYLDCIFKKEILNKASIEQYKNLCMLIVDSLIDLLEKDGIRLEKKDLIEANSLDLLLVDFTKIDEIINWIFNFTDKIISYVKEYINNSCRLVIKKALDYIENHYKEDISIEEVAETVSLSANYFSHIFKKARRESFTNHLNKLRIKEAQKIFSTTLYKVYEVSDMVGFNDYKYFSSVFKKFVGISPAQYCNNVR